MSIKHTFVTYQRAPNVYNRLQKLMKCSTTATYKKCINTAGNFHSDDMHVQCFADVKCDGFVPECKYKMQLCMDVEDEDDWMVERCSNFPTALSFKQSSPSSLFSLCFYINPHPSHFYSSLYLYSSFTSCLLCSPFFSYISFFKPLCYVLPA